VRPGRVGNSRDDRGDKCASQAYLLPPLSTNRLSPSLYPRDNRFASPEVLRARSPFSLAFSRRPSSQTWRSNIIFRYLLLSIISLLPSLLVVPVTRFLSRLCRTRNRAPCGQSALARASGSLRFTPLSPPLMCTVITLLLSHHRPEQKGKSMKVKYGARTRKPAFMHTA